VVSQKVATASAFLSEHPAATKSRAQKIAAGKKSRMVGVLKTNVLVALVSG
jgi:hypothetical protein